MLKFETRRKLDTRDDEKDFLINLGDDIPMSYAYKKNTQNWGVKHDEWDVFTLLVTENGVFDANIDLKELLRSDTHE